MARFAYEKAVHRISAIGGAVLARLYGSESEVVVHLKTIDREVGTIHLSEKQTATRFAAQFHGVPANKHFSLVLAWGALRNTECQF